MVPPDSDSDSDSDDPNAVTLAGPRVVLRSAVDEDRPVLGAILSEPEVASWWGPFEPETAFDELDASFVIVVEGAVVGWLLFGEEDWWQYRHVSFDIALSAAVHGQGYAREALRVLIRWFVLRGHHRFTIDPAADNARAIRAYEAVGFKPVGVLRAYERRDGAWHDGLLMDLLSDELIDA